MNILLKSLSKNNLIQLSLVFILFVSPKGFSETNIWKDQSPAKDLICLAENIYWEYSYKFISGEIPLTDFDSYVETWLKSGGKDITDYANKVLK